METWYIHKYEVALQYGGAEEGGWWYEVGMPTEMTFGPFIATEDDAFAQCCHANERERERRDKEEDYDYHSVLAYRSTHYSYDVTNDPEPHTYPTSRPHYE